jgi:hypothetical protein
MAKKMISLEISDELREALRIEAFKRSLSISALIRQLLESSLAQSNQEGIEANE